MLLQNQVEVVFELISYPTSHKSPFKAPKTLHPNVNKYPQCGFPTNIYETVSDYPVVIGTGPPLLVAPNPMGGMPGSMPGSMPVYDANPMDVWNYWNDYYFDVEKSGPKFKNGDNPMDGDQPMGGYDEEAVNEYAHCITNAGGQAQDSICPEHIGDHKCHDFLNTPECGFDEGDCCEEDFGNDVEDTCYGCVCYESEFSEEPSSEFEFH